MINNLEFSKRLQMVMDYYQLSAAAFADKIQVQRSSISHLLSGRNKPSLDFVLKVLDNFKDVELYWLLNGKGSFPADKKVDSSSSENNISLEDVEFNNNNKQKEIERVIIFYKDGSFKDYKNGL
ncbi:XRE family transcriptional regulator [Aureibaculum marinum]|uniref:XRE family transcriptional regulator n=1 Tax=Aureibaculum marinum TaxID=2487930 RepID=A0A3N4NNP9_9FLAO|nr:helix-turn-helix transcriptional regulator [Aureibaculum marinum]RPD97982.1 XRE family transcriptional regulator [Aureibaculum marinum]